MRFKRENKGFSLVELVVVIAIFAVVGVVVGGFLLASNRTYAITATELDIQDEAQLVANQLQEIFLDTSLGISYQHVAIDDAGAEDSVFMYDDADAAPVGTLSQKQVYVYGEDYYYCIYWDKDAYQLYMIEYVKTPAGYTLADGMPTEGVLLGNFIYDFKVDLSNVAKDRMVSFDINFKKNPLDRDYLVSRTVSLRNNVLTNKTKEEVYSSVGIEFEPVADQISVVPTYATLWPGEELKYTVTLTCSKGGVPSQDVNWTYTSLDGRSVSSFTKVTLGGMLKVSTDEECSLIGLTASASGYDYTSNVATTLKKDNLQVAVRQIRGINVVSNDFNTTPISAGGTYIVEVALTGDNLTGLTATQAGGINVSLTAGSGIATITNVEDIGNLKMRYTIKISDTAAVGSDVALAFSPARDGFTDIRTTLGVYKIGGADTGMLDIASSDPSQEWLRLGTTTTNVSFTDSGEQDSYMNADGTFKTGYFLRYTYSVYDSNAMLVDTAYKVYGASGNVFTDWLVDAGGTALSCSMKMTDKIFITSGSVLVKAELMHQTAGSAVVVGSSKELTYTIPQATIGFRRSLEDVASSNMNAYITKDANNMPIYLSFSSGFASPYYTISLDKVQCTPATLGGVSPTLSNLANRMVMVTGKSDADYSLSAGNELKLTYGGLTNSVTIKLVSANVVGTNYYVPTERSEWSVLSSATQGTDTTDKYVYFIDDTHKMEITYLNGVFSNAVYYQMENVQWVNKGNFKLNLLNKTWDLVTP